MLLFEFMGLLPLIITKVIIRKVEQWYSIMVVYGKIYDIGC